MHDNYLLCYAAGFDAFRRLLTRPIQRRSRPSRLLFCLVDHYEPGNGGVSPEVEQARVSRLIESLPQLVKGHADASGVVPKRTWFFPPHYHRYGTLKQLVSLCEAGYGEIELHLHHGKDRPDTCDNLRQTLECCVTEYSTFGIFGSHLNRKRYAFIHGDWALANSSYGRFCGVNDELQVLRATGCYADFTFPSLTESNPLQINSIYYASEKQSGYRSYCKGVPVRTFRAGSDSVMLIQGPVNLRWNSQFLLPVEVVGDAIDQRNPFSPARVDAWVRTGVHVEGRPNWVFVKTHTHGAPAADVVLGKDMDELHSYLEYRYNDGRYWTLHYVTAREMYNICKAAEAGEPDDNPDTYRNYKIEAPVYDSSPAITEASTLLQGLIRKTYSG